VVVIATTVLYKVKNAILSQINLSPFCDVSISEFTSCPFFLLQTVTVNEQFVFIFYCRFRPVFKELFHNWN